MSDILSIWYCHNICVMFEIHKLIIIDTNINYHLRFW